MRYQNTNILRVTSICLAILFLGLISSPVVHAGTYSYVTQWGSKGSANGQFDSPRGVTLDKSGNVYVADRNNHRIQKFDSNGNFLKGWNTFGNNSKFSYPTGIAVDSSGNIYVANCADMYDFKNQAVVKLNSNGGFIKRWGAEVIGDGSHFEPWGIAVDPSGNVYVSEYTWNHRIVKFKSDGYCLTQWGSKGSANGQFSWPHGITADSSGNVYVADTENYRVQKFNSGGTYISKWGSYGRGNGQFYFPVGVAVDSKGNVFVTDTYFDTIQKFDSNGTYLLQWGAGGNYNGQFSDPEGIAVNSSGFVYVADTGNNRIQVFAPPPISLAANFTCNITSGYASLTVQFKDTSIGNPTSWQWNFGDGKNSTLQNPTHTYSTAGNYTVNLTVTNSNVKSSKLAKITVLKPVSCNTSTIYGYSFNDSNKNKIKDTGELGLSNMTISLNGYDTCKKTLVSTTTKTNSTGYFAFNGVDPGVYVVSENFVIGWLPTSDTSYTPLTVPANSTKIRRDFGNIIFAK